jgi:broad specificity phosphatase PhoE
VSGRIHFVRHAETLFNVNGQLQGWCDSPLTVRGEAQVAALGEWMRDVPLAAAFTSDLTRTRTTTAGALVGHPHLVPTPLRDLREWHFGSWEGQPNAALWEPVFAAHGRTYAPGSAALTAMTADGFDSLLDAIADADPLGRAENAAEVGARSPCARTTILAAVEQAGRDDAGDVLVVTHGAVLGTLLRALLPGHAALPGFPNCGIVTVTWLDGSGTAAPVDASCAAPAGY